MSTIKMIKHNMDHKDGIYIYGISDLHVGSKEFNEALFNRVQAQGLTVGTRYLFNLLGFY